MLRTICAVVVPIGLGIVATARAEQSPWDAFPDGTRAITTGDIGRLAPSAAAESPASSEPAPVPPFAPPSSVVAVFARHPASQFESCDDCVGCDGIHCDGVACDGTVTGDCVWGEDGDCPLLDEQPLLHDFRDRTLFADVTYSIGGELRYRYMDERNRLRPLGTLRRDTYQLWRFAPFLEAGNDWITGYVQGIDAAAFNEDLPILPIDENRWDLLQYYVDARLHEFERGDLRGRVGRMFLKYGDQHFISPLPWANTYRNFQGGRLYYAGENWDIDGFVVRPLNGAASPFAFHPESFDKPDESILFSGVYATYKQAKNGVVDLFWLWNDEDEPRPIVQDGSRHTIGVRYAGSYAEEHCKTVVRTWTWDLLGAWQFGEDDFLSGGREQNVSAGAISTIGTLTLNEVPWSPTLTGLFWWGSGDPDPTDGELNTLSTLYPFGHYYWGQIDNLNGANLLDYSIQISASPAAKLTLAAQMHWFNRADENDFIYNIGGAPLGNTTTAARHIGNELDLVATYQLNENLQLQAGYFWFWYGDAVDDQPALRRDDAHEFYFMTTWGF